MRDLDAAWFIGVVAAGLVVWGVIEFLELAPREPQTAEVLPAAEQGGRMPRPDAIELHRLLPHATRQLGTEVRLDGTVVDAATGPGFWVRDLRDNVVFVDNNRAAAPVEPGDPVRVLGTVALLPLEDRGTNWQAVQEAVPPTALLVRDVKVTPADGGIEILRDD